MPLGNVCSANIAEMSMFDKPIRELSMLDIERLVNEQQERESLHLEYKQSVEFTEGAKNELRKDITGMANAAGATLLIGISENPDGRPKEICGVPTIVGSQKIDEWINNVMLFGVSPRVRYQMKTLAIDPGRVVVVLDIPESRQKPHMVETTNRYYVRHNRSVDPATHVEVREMFEYSRRVQTELEAFLRKRKLWDEEAPDFGSHMLSRTLCNARIMDARLPVPYLLFSVMPTDLTDMRLDANSDDTLQWLKSNANGYPPMSQVPLYRAIRHTPDIDGIAFIHETRRSGVPTHQRTLRYTEFLDSGMFESGFSVPVFTARKVKGGPTLKVASLAGSVGYFWAILEFSRGFYRRFGYFGEVMAQVSATNVQGYALGGFGQKNSGEKWVEPYSERYEDPPVCRRKNFKLVARCVPVALEPGEISEKAFWLAQQISRAFGLTQVRCFDDDGTFNAAAMPYWSCDWPG